MKNQQIRNNQVIRENDVDYLDFGISDRYRVFNHRLLLSRVIALERHATTKGTRICCLDQHQTKKCVLFI